MLFFGLRSKSPKFVSCVIYKNLFKNEYMRQSPSHLALLYFTWIKNGFDIKKCRNLMPLVTSRSGSVVFLNYFLLQ